MTDVVTFRVLKEDTCPSLSERSVLTYLLGCREINGESQEGIYIRILRNSGKGCFNSEWVSFASLESVLKEGASLSCHSLKDVFSGKSVNTGGFLLAVLKDLGLIDHSEHHKRRYDVCDLAAFKSEMTELMKSDIRLDIPEAANKRKPKPAKEKPVVGAGKPRKAKARAA